MRGLPSSGVRFAVEAGFVGLVALGASLVGLGTTLIVVLVAVAVALVAVLERAYAREAARAHQQSVSHGAARADAEPTPAEALEPESEQAPETEAARGPELAVSERSARAILASGPPPGAEAASPKPEPEPDPEPETAEAGQPREWNLWNLQALVRDRPEDPRHEEWTALVLSLREFASPDGKLPLEFDELVRESFGGVVAEARTEAAATP